MLKFSKIFFDIYDRESFVIKFYPTNDYYY